MSKLDFEFSIQGSFLILHILFIAGAAFYGYNNQFQVSILFITSSAISLLYYTLFQTSSIQRRQQAHLNLIEEAIQESEEFKEGVKKKKEEEEKQPPMNDTEITEQINELYQKVEDSEKKNSGKSGEADTIQEEEREQ